VGRNTLINIALVAIQMIEKNDNIFHPSVSGAIKMALEEFNWF